MKTMHLQSKWVKAYTLFLAVFAFGAGITAYLSPQAMFSMLDIDWNEARLLSNGFAARNISVGILTVITLLWKNAHVYLALFVTRLSIDLQDMGNGIFAGSDAIPPVLTVASLGIFFILPLILGIRTILKELKQTN